MRWQDRISVDPNVCHGKACIKGTRVMVSVILDGLAAGESSGGIVQAYRLTPDDISAALLYAAALSKECVVSIDGGQRGNAQDGRGSSRHPDADPGSART